MEILSIEDVDKFFDKFQDPAYEVDSIIEQLEEVTGGDIKRAFIKRLIMKSYRLGKEHAYAATMDVIRKRDSL
jgi:hypothetical protein